MLHAFTHECISESDAIPHKSLISAHKSTQIDRTKSGHVKYKALEETFMQLGFEGRREQLELVAQSFKRRGDGRVNYRRLLAKRGGARRERPQFAPAAQLRQAREIERMRG